jgi:hypothetical protein
MVGPSLQKGDSKVNTSTSAVKNERLQSLLDEETEKLDRQNAEYEQLKSSAVSPSPSRRAIPDQSNSPR